MPRSIPLFLVILCSAAYASGEAASWPQSLHASVPAAALPSSLDPESAAWIVDLPGPGASIPAIVGDRLFVTCEIDGADGVVCLGSDGRELWRKTLAKAVAGKHRNATGANPSPVTDDDNVYVFFKDTTLAAIDHDGNEVWCFKLEDRFGEGLLWWDRGASPVLSSEGLVVAITEGPDNSYVATIDCGTGETKWKTDRHFDCAQESDQSYTTPAVATIDGAETIVTWGADHLTGHDAASGELLWECGGFNPNNEGMWRTIASAAVADGLAVVPHGRGDWLSGVKLGGRGDVTDTAILWTVPQAGADVPTPWIGADRVYVLRDNGEVLCLDLMSGASLWADKLPRSRAKFYSSPVFVSDRVYAVREDGSAVVGKLLGDGIEVVDESELGDLVVATPVLTPKGLLVRTREKMMLFTGEPRVGGSPAKKQMR